MTRFPGVYRRADSNTYQFGIKPPQDLRHHFSGQWAIRCSLGTSDLREANDKARALHAEWALKFDALRRADNPQRVTLNPTLAATIAAEVRRWVLEADDNMRSFPDAVPRALVAREELAMVQAQAEELADSPLSAVLPAAFFRSALTIGAPPSTPKRAPVAAPVDPLAGLNEPQHTAVARFNASEDGAAAVNLARRNLRAALPLAEAVARSMGLVVDWTDEAGRAALLECLKAYRGAVADLTRRDAGEAIDTPSPAALAPPSPPPTPGPKGHTFLDAFEAWRDAAPGRPRKSIVTYEAAAEKLAALLPGKNIEDVTREDGRTVVAALLREAEAKGGKAQNTAANHLSRFKTLLAQAVDLEWIDRNPFAGRTIKSVDSDRTEWGPADLARLFDDPLFTAYQLPPSGMAGMDAAYFLPLLGLYTGARISELAQLATDDLKLAEDAGPVLAIREDAERGQRLKTAASVREVPVHPELVRLGLLDYWGAIKEHGAGPLFPAIARTELNGAGGKVSQWFGKYKTAKGFGTGLVFHSFRHTLHTRLVAVGVPAAHADALAGRSGRSVGEKHYLHLKPADLRPSLERLSFPSLKLQRVFKVPAWAPRSK